MSVGRARVCALAVVDSSSALASTVVTGASRPQPAQRCDQLTRFTSGSGVIELRLGMGTSRGDRRRPGRQADAFEVALNRAGLGEGRPAWRPVSWSLPAANSRVSP